MDILLALVKCPDCAAALGQACSPPIEGARLRPIVHRSRYVAMRKLTNGFGATRFYLLFEEGGNEGETMLSPEETGRAILIVHPREEKKGKVDEATR